MLATLLKLPACRLTLKNNTKAEPPTLGFNCFLPRIFLNATSVDSMQKTTRSWLLNGEWEGSLFFLPRLKHKQFGNNFFDKVTQLRFFITSSLTQKKYQLKLFAKSKTAVSFINFPTMKIPDNVEELTKNKWKQLIFEAKIIVSPLGGNQS